MDPKPGIFAVEKELPADVSRYLTVSAPHDIDEVVRCFADPGGATSVNSGTGSSGPSPWRRG